MNRKHFLYISLLLLIVILLAAILAYLYTDESTPSLPTDANAVNWEGRQMLQQAFSDGGGIAIPGFNSLAFAANQTTQKVNFYNPEINDCLFQLVLLIEDVPVWESENILPGQGFYEIELDEPLQTGEYSACLKVNCFSADGEQLNSATVEFELIVQ